MTKARIHATQRTLDRRKGIEHLAAGSALLQLSVETPDRVPGWDIIALTAAGANQARLYSACLEAARRRGLIPAQTRTVVIEDPEGKRIGSGGATLNALRRLSEMVEGENLSDLKALLVHAGGDGRRVPWAGVFGKCFIPFPLLADPDKTVPTVFDHQLAALSPLPSAMGGGGLVSISGDVLPLFDASRLPAGTAEAAVVTCPVSLDVAERHGVVVANRRGRVTDLLQKTPAAELMRSGGIVQAGAAALDTGIYIFRGETYKGLLECACATPDPVTELLENGAELSLYEEIAGAMVKSRHAAVRAAPLGKRILRSLGGSVLYAFAAPDLVFLHFGATSEILDLECAAWDGRLARRILVRGTDGCRDGSVVLMSDLSARAEIGEGSLVFGSRLGAGVRIGKRCVCVGVSAESNAFALPDNSCLWQVPVTTTGAGEPAGTVTALCGTDDNPKEPYESGTFCNRSFSGWMDDHDVTPGDLWEEGEPRTLWNARLFPAGAGPECFDWTAWMLRESGNGSGKGTAWRPARRYSLAQVHATADDETFARTQQGLGDDLVRGVLDQVVPGAGERNVRALSVQLSPREENREFLARMSDLVPHEDDDTCPVTHSRLLQIRSDLLHGAGQSEKANILGRRAFEAVRGEVAQAVQEHVPDPVRDLRPGVSATVRLPARFDIAGGWSDTPPYCLERPARVLNLAMELNGECPIGAEAESLADLRWELELGNSGISAILADGDMLEIPPDPADPLMLLRTALLQAGFGRKSTISQGVRLKTWSNVPKGSGLGTSSILGAAVLMALDRLAGRPHDDIAVTHAVLLLEQRMTTGGGWQDQVGGLVPGIKTISSLPVKPIRLRVDPVPLLPDIVDRLENELVIAFTGKERLAKNVLQIVVGKYLSRNRHAVSAVAALVELADEGRRAIALGDMPGLGRVMNEVWRVHQELDPHCSNADVDAILREVEDLSLGAKLAGAGGGGFLGVLAKDKTAAGRIRTRLGEMGLSCYRWTLATGPGTGETTT